MAAYFAKTTWTINIMEETEAQCSDMVSLDAFNELKEFCERLEKRYDELEVRYDRLAYRMHELDNLHSSDEDMYL